VIGFLRALFILRRLVRVEGSEVLPASPQLVEIPQLPVRRYDAIFLKCLGLSHDSDTELIFAESVVQARESSPIAGCAYMLPGEDSAESNKDTIHLFFVNTNGIIADQTSIVTRKFPPSVAPWAPGTIQGLELKIPPASKIAASCSTDDSRDIVVIFEQDSTLVSSHLFEAIRQGDEAWKVLPRPNHQLEAARGGPLLVFHPDDTATFSILYHSIATGSFNLSKGDPDLENPYITEEVMPPSHLPFDVRANGYGGNTRVCFAANPWVCPSGIYVAMRDEDDTVHVRFWQIEEGAGRSIKTLHRVCKTRPQTDFCLTSVQESRLLIFLYRNRRPDGDGDTQYQRSSGSPREITAVANLLGLLQSAFDRTC
jgi:hypothetical protein